MANVQFGFERDAYNYEIVNQVASILNFFTTAGYNFTAHDITKQVRTMLGPKIKVEHEDVRKAVHIAMSGRAKYTTEDNGKFILYKKHIPAATVKVLPSSSNAKPQSIKTKPFVSQPLPAVNIKVDSNVLKGLKQLQSRLGKVRPFPQLEFRKPDRRGSITVPKKLIDNVKCIMRWGIITDNQTPKTKKLIPVTSSSRIKYETTYTKDKSGNIRVTKKHLPASRTNEYKVTWSNNGEVLIQGV